MLKIQLNIQLQHSHNLKLAEKIMIWPILIIVVLITKVCQSLTVIQPIYDVDQNFYKSKEVQGVHKEVKGVTEAAIKNQTRAEYGLRNSPNLNRRPIAKSEILQPYELALKTRLLSRVQPYKSGMISNILSLTPQPALLAFREQPAYSNIYPVQYQYHNPYHRALTKLPLGNEPVTAATLNTEVLHQPTKETLKIVNNATLQQPLQNYNNKIYHHVNKAISNRSFTQQQQQEQQYPPFVRKQRNSNTNHYDDKLIEHNFTETRDDTSNKDIDDDSGQGINTTASSIEQPSTSTSSSHEIRYLHDIFLNYPQYHHVNYGHIELSPHLFQKRFESLKAGNRYKGEVIWLDNTGGYSQHYWNMAQGKL